MSSTLTDVKPDGNKVKMNTGGASSNNQIWRVVDEGKSYFVQTRVDKDGNTAFVIVKPGVAVSITKVLATISPSGELTYGGSGAPYDNENKKSLAPYTTTSEDAQNILNTGTINNSTYTIEDQFNVGSFKAKNLAKAANDNRTQSSQQSDRFLEPSKAITTGQSVVELAVIPSEANATGISTTPSPEQGVQPGNNQPGVGSTTAGSIQESLQEGIDFIIEKGKELNENLLLSEKQIAEFDKLFQEGGGDKIEGAKYPFDANYGDIRGQDYVTIDQFIYQPPRRDQIFGDRNANPDKRINPIENLTQGTQRITPLKKFVAMVKLPMPNDITDSNAVAWGDDVMNGMSAAITSAVMQNPAAGLLGAGVGMFSQPVGKILTLALAGMNNGGIVGPDGKRDTSLSGLSKGLFAKLQTEGGEALMKTNLGAGILGALGVNVTPESLLSRGFGVIPNSNVELLFNNVTLRDFQFSWRMSPRDEQEALEVKKIIRFFKQGMAAKTMKSKAGDRTLYLGTPNIFRLQYRTASGKIIEGVNRIKPCAVVGCAVNYTPDGQWSAYDEGQPVSCTISIQMKELEPVYASDYTEDVIDSRRSNDRTTGGFVGPLANPDEAFDSDMPVGDGDLYPIRPTEVGY